jgi:predicted MarR family transcription regulator
MEDFNKTFDKISVKYDNVILIGDLNYNVLDEDKKGTPLTNMCDIFDYTNLVKTATCHTKNFEYALFTSSSTIWFSKFRLVCRSFKKISCLKSLKLLYRIKSFFNLGT